MLARSMFENNAACTYSGKEFRKSRGYGGYSLAHCSDGPFAFLSLVTRTLCQVWEDEDDKMASINLTQGTRLTMECHPRVDAWRLALLEGTGHCY